MVKILLLLSFLSLSTQFAIAANDYSNNSTTIIDFETDPPAPGDPGDPT